MSGRSNLSVIVRGVIKSLINKYMNNRQDFERFAVLYWGQHVIQYDHQLAKGLHIVNSDSLKTDDEFYVNPFLYLRSIESLTDEEIKTLVRDIWQIGFDDWDTPQGIQKAVEHYRLKNDFAFGGGGHAMIRISDYLRSIGILVPFAQYSVEQILEMGWAKIK